MSPIAPLVSPAATPAAEPAVGAAPDASAAPTPRFADALARAGQSPSAPQPTAKADGTAPPSGRQDEPRPSGAAAEAATQTAAAAASTLPPQDAGALQALAVADAAAAANTASTSGKNLPPAHHKPDDDPAALPTAGPLPPALVLPAASAPPTAAADDAVPQSATATAAATAVADLRARSDAAAAQTVPAAGPDHPQAQTAGQPAASGRPEVAPALLAAATASVSGGERPVVPTLPVTAPPSGHLTAENAAQQAAAVTTGQGVPGAAAILPPWVASAQAVPQPGWVATVPPHVASPDWGQAMNQQVLIAAQGQQQFATLHLNPPQLGPLQVHLQLHDGQVQAQFVSPHAVVRQAVEAALPQLHDLFSSAGLALTQTSVGAQGQPGQRPPQGRAQPTGAVAAAAAAPQPVAMPVATAALRWQQGLVNTYA